MLPKKLVRNCNCVHCKQKLEQINRSRVYWDKVIISKLNAQIYFNNIVYIRYGFNLNKKYQDNYDYIK